MTSDPLLDRLRAQLRVRRLAAIKDAVTIKTAGTAYGERTVAQIDHRLPEPGRGTRAAFRVTTTEQFLPRAHFDRSVREIVNRAATERGRRIYAIDLSGQEVMAVLSYHLHDSSSRPLLITALGTRAPTRMPRPIYTQGASHWSGCSSSTRTRSATAPTAEATWIWTRRTAPRVSGFSPSGRHLRQDATDPH
jgi:hypothetical protein